MNSPTTLIAHAALTAEALNDLIIDSIQDIKGKRILKLDLRKIPDAPADFFIICGYLSPREFENKFKFLTSSNFGHIGSWV